MRTFLFMAAFVLVQALALCGASLAGIASKQDAVSPDKAWNPRPEKDDIILPMPCGLQLALRAVAVPAGTLLQDKHFFMGISAVSDDKRQVYERRFPAYIAASFTPEDLPAAWRPLLTAKEGYAYYFIGKYEISEQQWRAVMDNQCPAAPTTAALQPKGGISWHDAQSFFQKYNAWLLKEKPDSLPHFANNANNVGFLRLPTEEEWEFAARGGSKVREEDLMQNEIFPLEGGSLADYGLFTENVPVHEPAPIGARKANPLGLYDTVGNVKELVDGFFHLSVADMDAGGAVSRRRHGGAGGMICKGGSFRSTAQGVLPGWRDEVPLYIGTGENRPADIGFRVVLAGLNVPSGQRLNELAQENRAGVTPAAAAEAKAPQETSKEAPRPAAEKDVAITLNPEGSALGELAKISAVTSTEAMRGNLAQLRSILENEQAAGQRQRADMQENSLRALLYQAETLRNIAYRYHTAHLALEKYLKEKKQKGEDAASSNARKTLRSTFELILTSTNFYKTCLSRLLPVAPKEINRILTQLRQEYKGDDMLSQHMQQNIVALEKHLTQARAKGVDALIPKGICKDIIPELHFKVLPF